MGERSILMGTHRIDANPLVFAGRSTPPSRYRVDGLGLQGARVFSQTVVRSVPPRVGKSNRDAARVPLAKPARTRVFSPYPLRERLRDSARCVRRRAAGGPSAASSSVAIAAVSTWRAAVKSITTPAAAAEAIASRKGPQTGRGVDGHRAVDDHEGMSARSQTHGQLVRTARHPTAAAPRRAA